MSDTDPRRPGPEEPGPEELRALVLDPSAALPHDVLVGAATPVITDHPGDPDRQRILFLWQPTGGDPDPAGAYVWVNRLTDKNHADAGLMRRKPGTRLWFTEITAPRGTMAGYRIYPFAADSPGVVDGRIVYSREVVRGARIDTRNTEFRAGSPFGSVLRCAGAPPLGDWVDPVAAPGVTETLTLTADGRVLRCPLSVPGRAADGAPGDLLVVFDAEKWFGRYRLPAVLARAASAGRVARRFAVVGIESPAAPGDRLAVLGGNRAVLDAVATELIPRVRGQLPGPPSRVIVAGQSLGGLAALSLAAWHPGVVDEVLAYSPSVWCRPGLTARPAQVHDRQEWIHDQLRAATGRLPRLRLAVGEFEEELEPTVRASADTAVAHGFATELRTYPGGHDDCWWAAYLLDDLM